MKITLLLCGTISAALVLLGCSNQDTAAKPASPTAYKGLVGPGSVSGVSGGPAPGHIRQKYQP